MNKVKAYKGFNKDLTCRGFQFEEGKEYHEERAELCKSGFHACENPLDCFGYYSPTQSVYHEVELDEVSDKCGDDSKICGKHIKIGAKLDVLGICKAHFEYVKKNCVEKIEKGEAEQAAAGNYGSAAAGNHGSAAAGDNGSAVSRGKSAVDKNGIAVVRGNNVKAKGGIGSVIVIINENVNNYDVAEWKIGVIDGETLKADTWYKLENGEFVEVQDD